MRISFFDQEKYQGKTSFLVEKEHFYPENDLYGIYQGYFRDEQSDYLFRVTCSFVGSYRSYLSIKTEYFKGEWILYAEHIEKLMDQEEGALRMIEKGTWSYRFVNTALFEALDDAALGLGYQSQPFSEEKDRVL